MTFGTEVMNSTIWMNYSSIIGSTVLSRNVSVIIADGTVPTGLKLALLTSAATSGTGPKGVIVPGAIDIPSMSATFQHLFLQELKVLIQEAEKVKVIT